MTRRMIFILTALLGVAGVLLALASPASAQTGLPFTFDIGALLRQIFASLPAFLQAILAPLFAALLQAFTGSCAPFCAS